jgi:hypothetical protein
MPYEIRRGDITIRVTNDREFEFALNAVARMGVAGGKASAAPNGAGETPEAQLLDEETPTEPLEDRFFQNITNE